jgi:hypothetical protein
MTTHPIKTPPAAGEGSMKTVKPLLATRFKLGFNKAGNCTTFRKDQAAYLEGTWVWLIEATDGMNAPLVSVADLEQVGIVNEAGDHIDVAIDEDLLWSVGEKLYRFKDGAA